MERIFKLALKTRLILFLTVCVLGGALLPVIVLLLSAPIYPLILVFLFAFAVPFGLGLFIYKNRPAKFFVGLALGIAFLGLLVAVQGGIVSNRFASQCESLGRGYIAFFDEGGATCVAPLEPIGTIAMIFTVSKPWPHRYFY